MGCTWINNIWKSRGFPKWSRKYLPAAHCYRFMSRAWRRNNSWRMRKTRAPPRLVPGLLMTWWKTFRVQDLCIRDSSVVCWSPFKSHLPRIKATWTQKTSKSSAFSNTRELRIKGRGKRDLTLTSRACRYHTSASWRSQKMMVLVLASTQMMIQKMITIPASTVWIKSCAVPRVVAHTWTFFKTLMPWREWICLRLTILFSIRSASSWRPKPWRMYTLLNTSSNMKRFRWSGGRLLMLKTKTIKRNCTSNTWTKSSEKVTRTT